MSEKIALTEPFQRIQDSINENHQLAQRAIEALQKEQKIREKYESALKAGINTLLKKAIDDADKEAVARIPHIFGLSPEYMKRLGFDNWDITSHYKKYDVTVTRVGNIEVYAACEEDAKKVAEDSTAEQFCWNVIKATEVKEVNN